MQEGSRGGGEEARGRSAAADGSETDERPDARRVSVREVVDEEEGRGGGGEKEREGQGGSSLLALLRAEQKPLVTTHQPLPPNPPLMYVQPLPCILKFNVIYFIVRSCSEVSIGMGTPLL